MVVRPWLYCVFFVSHSDNYHFKCSSRCCFFSKFNNRHFNVQFNCISCISLLCNVLHIVFFYIICKERKHNAKQNFQNCPVQSKFCPRKVGTLTLGIAGRKFYIALFCPRRGCPRVQTFFMQL